MSQAHPGPFRAPSALVSGLWSLRMATRPLLQSRDAVTKATRGDTRALRDFFRETEPARAAGGERGPQRAASLGGLLGLFRSDKKAKDKEKEKERGERGSVRINTPPPGTVAITHNSGYVHSLCAFPCIYMRVFNRFRRHTVYMIGQPAAPLLPPPTVPPKPEHEPLPRRSPRVAREEYPAGKPAAQHGPPRPRSRMGLGPHAAGALGIGVGMTLANGSLSSESEMGLLLDARGASAPGRASVNNGAEHGAQANDPARQAHQRVYSTASGGTGTPRASSDRNEHAQPPPYNEATERISIFIDSEALQALQASSESQGSGGGLSAGLLEKLRAARGQYHLQGVLPNTYYPAPAPHAQQTVRRPLPPVPTTARPDSRSGYAHHRSSVIIPVHQSAFDHISTPRRNEDVHLPLAPPQQQQQQQPCNMGTRTDPKLCGRSQAPPRDYVGPIAPLHPPRLDTAAEESLHVDELDVAERKPPSKMEKALLRRIEFGLKVDYSILQLT